MNEFEFPDPPDAKDIPWYRRIPPVYLWWIGAFLLLGGSIFWLPTQCVLDDIGIPNDNSGDELNRRIVDQDKDLDFRKDGLWYEVESNRSFSGYAESYHSNGKLKSRTKIRDGVAYGLIEEWDENGSMKGTPFKDEFRK